MGNTARELKIHQGEDPFVQVPTDELVATARQKLVEYLEAGHVAEDVAVGCGYALSSVNLFKTGKYANTDGRAIATAIMMFFHEQDEKIGCDANQLAPVRSIASFRATWAALEQVRRKRNLGIIYGAPGVGKTFPAKVFADQYRRVKIIHMRPGMSRQKGFLMEAYRVLKNLPAHESGWLIHMTQKVYDIVERDKPMLIINEGCRAEFDVWEMLVDLIDQCGASVAVLGNTYRIQRKFFSIRARRNGEIYERIGSFANFTEVVHAITPDQARELAGQMLPSLTDDGALFLANKTGKTVDPNAPLKGVRDIVITCQMAQTLLANPTKKLIESYGGRDLVVADERLLMTALDMRNRARLAL